MADPNTNGLDPTEVRFKRLETRLDRMDSRQNDYDQILNKSNGVVEGELIKLTASVGKLVNEFCAQRQDIVNIKGAVEWLKAGMAELLKRKKRRVRRTQ